MAIATDILLIAVLTVAVLGLSVIAIDFSLDIYERYLSIKERTSNTKKLNNGNKK